MLDTEAGELCSYASWSTRVFTTCCFPVQARIAVLVKQMAAAIRYIHSMGMVHRDIKSPKRTQCACNARTLLKYFLGRAPQVGELGLRVAGSREAEIDRLWIGHGLHCRTGR